VLVVTDRASLQEITELLHCSGVEVVGAAFAPETALALLHSAHPSLVALDLDAPLLDGLQVLELLVRERVAPVVTFARQAGSTLVVRAVALGASEVITRAELRAWGDRKSRPSLPLPRIQSGVSIRPLSASSRPSERPRSRPAPARPELFAIGASTGGTLALSELLKPLPASTPPILIVQHMLAEFTHDFAAHLNGACQLEVREAEHGDRVQRGRVLIARGGWHMRLARAADGVLCVRLSDESPVGKHRPSVDVLFHSCAEVLGPAAAGVLLTGLGDDGAAGLLAMRNVGAPTVVQDESSSACFGMPRAAIARGAAERVLSLQAIALLLAGDPTHNA
jgi:two-component system chemotaxis response regulator CheB